MGVLPRAVVLERLTLELADAHVVEVGHDDVRDFAITERDRRRLLGTWETRSDQEVDVDGRDLLAERARRGPACAAQPTIERRIAVDHTGDVEERLTVASEQEDPHGGDVNAPRNDPAHPVGPGAVALAECGSGTLPLTNDGQA